MQWVKEGFHDPDVKDDLTLICIYTHVYVHVYVYVYVYV